MGSARSTEHRSGRMQRSSTTGTPAITVVTMITGHRGDCSATQGQPAGSGRLQGQPPPGRPAQGQRPSASAGWVGGLGSAALRTSRARAGQLRVSGPQRRPAPGSAGSGRPPSGPAAPGPASSGSAAPGPASSGSAAPGVGQLRVSRLGLEFGGDPVGGALGPGAGGDEAEHENCQAAADDDRPAHVAGRGEVGA